MKKIFWLFQFVLLEAFVTHGLNITNIPGHLEEIIRSSFNNVSMAYFKGKPWVPGNNNRVARNIHKPNMQSMQVACIMESMQQANSRIDTELAGALEEAAPLMSSTKTSLCNALSRTSCGSNRIHANRRHCNRLVRSTCSEVPINCIANDPYRSIDGTCNNLNNKRWGSADRIVARHLPAEYGQDGAPRTGKGNKPLPNPREVSNIMAKAKPRPPTMVSVMFMQWGQFLNHDITRTPEVPSAGASATPPVAFLMNCCGMGKLGQDSEPSEACLPIDVRKDPFYNGHNIECIRFVRSLSRPKSCGSAVKEQINMNTAYIDASQVYGSSADVADFVRTKSGGRLKYTDNASTGRPMPPFAGKDVPNTPTCPFLPLEEKKCFFAGDTRIDMVPGLTVMHAAFIRLHNIIADQLASINKYKGFYPTGWKDEKIYQETRRIVGALAQQITYRHWLPILLGENSKEWSDLYVKFEGSEYIDTYDPKEDSTIRNAFSAAAYRLHTLPGDILKGAVAADDFPQTGHFFNITVIQEANKNPSAMIKGLTRSPMEPADTVVGDALRNQLFTQAARPMPTGLDLVAINVKRGRDHGLPGYEKWRKECGLESTKKFKKLKKAIDSKLAKKFKKLYKKNLKNMDLFAAGLAENPINGDLLGPTFTCILGRQFKSLQHGDRFWYESKDQPKPFTPDQLKAIRQTSFSSILCKVAEGYSFQPNPFKTADVPGNDVKHCSHYKFLDLSSWKE